MAKKLWQVWTENDAESAKQGHIVDEKILHVGTELDCRRFTKTISDAPAVVHLGYACNGLYFPEKGDAWKGRFAEDVIIRVLRVSKKDNRVYCKVESSDYNKDVGKKIEYILDTFNQYWELA